MPLSATRTCRRLGANGFAYGDLYPDFMLLSCVKESRVGHDSVLVDGYRILEALAARAAIALRGRQIDQAETGMQTPLSPIRVDDDNGRTLEQRPAEASGDQERKRER